VQAVIGALVARRAGTKRLAIAAWRSPTIHLVNPSWNAMSRPTPPNYKTRNWPAHNEALKRRGSLTIWFDPEMSWDAAPTGRRGRQQTYSDAAVQTCLTMKVLFGMALRQTTGFVESLLGLVGLNWTVPDFSTLSRRQKTLAVNIPYRGSKGPLHLLVDSTGIKVEGEGEWNARKHGGPKRRVWRKVHVGIDEQTLEVRAVEMTGSHIGDAPVLLTYSARSRPTRRSRASPPTAPATPTSAITPSPTAVLLLSSRPAKTRSRASPSPQAQWPETRLCAHRNTSDARSGGTGADTTAEAVSRRRCIA
jgi:hypothetical protein